MHRLLRSSCQRWLACLWLLHGLLGAGVAQAGYVFSEIARPGADSTSVFDINNSGTMVGYSSTDLGGAVVSRGFITTDGSSFTELAGPAGAVSSAAIGISDTGIVVGSFGTSRVDALGDELVSNSGFIYSGGIYTVFTVAGATDTFLRGISADGRYLTGYFTTATQGLGFVYDTASAVFQTIAAPDSRLTIMQGINRDGIVVGSDILNDGRRPGVFYDIDTGTRTEGSIAGAQRTALRAIEDDGSLAGWFRDALGETHGFVGSLGNYEQIDFAGADATFLEGSNAAGVLVGNAQFGDQFRAFVARQAVPEPAGLALVLVAGLAAGVATRHRRSA